MSAIISKDELASHNTPESLWLAVDGKVYDLTKMHVSEHPGGPEPLKKHAGTDATAAFERVGHSESARKWREDFEIGSLAVDKPSRCCGLDEQTLTLTMAVGLPLFVILTMKFLSS